MESLIAERREVCAGLPDRRKAPGDDVYPMADIGLSAFSLFFMGSPSFLAHQRRSNAENLLVMRDPALAALYEQNFLSRIAVSERVN